MNLRKIVRDNLRAKEDKQGWNDLQFLLCLVLLNICGGDCVDDAKRRAEKSRRWIKKEEIPGKKFPVKE